MADRFSGMTGPEIADALRLVNWRVWQVLNLSRAILALEVRENMTLDELKATVENENTVIDSAIALLGGISQQLKDALANAADPAAIQAIADEIEAKKEALAAAITANTPTP